MVDTMANHHAEVIYGRDVHHPEKIDIGGKLFRGHRLDAVKGGLEVGLIPGNDGFGRGRLFAAATVSKRSVGDRLEKPDVDQAM